MTLPGKLGYQFSVVLLTRNRAAGTDLSTAWRVTQNSKMIRRNMQPLCRNCSFQSIQKGHVFQNSGSHIHALGHLIRPTDGKLGHFRTGRLGQMHGAHHHKEQHKLETVKPRAVSSPPASVVKCPQADMKGLEKITRIAGERREWYV